MHRDRTNEVRSRARTPDVDGWMPVVWLLIGLAVPSTATAQSDAGSSPEAGDRANWKTVESKRAPGVGVRVDWRVRERELERVRETGADVENLGGRLVDFRCVFRFSADGSSSEGGRFVDTSCPGPYPIFSPDGELAVVQKEPRAPRLYIVPTDALQDVLEGAREADHVVLAQTVDGEWAGELTTVGRWVDDRCLTLSSACCGSETLFAVDTTSGREHRVMSWSPAGGNYGQARVFATSPDGTYGVIRRDDAFHIYRAEHEADYLLGRTEPVATVPTEGWVSKFEGWTAETAFDYQTRVPTHDDSDVDYWRVVKKEGAWTTQKRTPGD